MRKWLQSVCVGLALFLSLAASAQPDPHSKRNAADALWMKIKTMVDEWTALRTPENVAEPLGVSPLSKVYAVRSLALEFYETYPDDRRSALLRSAFLIPHYTDPFIPFGWAVSRVQVEEKLRAEGDHDLDGKVSRLLQKTAGGAEDWEIKMAFHDLQRTIQEVRPPVHVELEILARLRSASSKKLSELVIGREKFLALREKPLEMKLPLLNGGELDFRQLHGKVVVVDVWSLGCPSCINSMPGLQALYEKYRERGLEVVGVYLSYEDEAGKQAIDNTRGVGIKKRQGATWPDTVIAGKAALQEFNNRFSLNGPGNVWLLDQRGRLVLDIDPGNDFMTSRAGQSLIEKEITRLLDAAPPAHVATLKATL